MAYVESAWPWVQTLVLPKKKNHVISWEGGNIHLINHG
jgi:hypothetical protein